MMFGAGNSGIKPYDGFSDPNVFINAFELNAFVFKWDDKDKATAIKHLLTEKAERVYEKVTDKTKIDDIYKELRDKCGLSNEKLLDRFFERKPREGETIQQFALALQDLLEKAMPGLGSKEKMVLLKRQLGVNLPEHIKALIHFNVTMDWDNLIKAVGEALPHVTMCEANEGKFAAIKAEPVELNAASVRYRGDRNRQDRDRKPKRFEGNCNFCKKYGHKAESCWKKNQKEKNSEALPRSSGDFKQFRSIKGSKSVNTLYLDRDSDDDSVNSPECNAITVECSTISDEKAPVLDLLSVAAKTPLMKKSVKIKLKKDSNAVSLKALFDGGATNSFIQLSSLAKPTQQCVREFLNNRNNKLNLQKETLTIRGATSSRVRSR